MCLIIKLKWRVTANKSLSPTSKKIAFNLNIPRYIDSSEAEDLQDIEAHLLGDIPNADIDALQNYWDVFPELKSSLFAAAKRSENYMSLQVSKDDIKQSIYQHPQFVAYINDMNQVFSEWASSTTNQLKALAPGFHPKELIHTISETLLSTYTGKPLINRYDVFQHLMNYWFETMQDDCYLIAAQLEATNEQSGRWQADTYRIIETNKKGKQIDKGWTCDLIPKQLVINRYFAEQQQSINELNAELETVQSQTTEMIEEHSGEDGAFAELDKINKGNIQKQLKMDNGELTQEDVDVLKQYLGLLNKEAVSKKSIKAAEAKLDAELLAFYPTLTEAQIKQLVVDDKWMASMDKDIHSEMDRISQRLTQRVKQLAERYETPLPQQTAQVAELEQTVTGHLEKMGFVVNRESIKEY